MALTRRANSSPSVVLRQLMNDHLVSLQVKGYSEYTVRNHRVHINMFVKWCAGRGIHAIVQITKGVLQDYERYVFGYRKRDGQPLTVASRFARLVPLRVWFRWMVRERIMKRNLAEELELPRIGRPLPRTILSPKDVERIVRQTNRQTVIGLRDRCILEFLYATGLRRLELARLTVADLQLDRKLVLVRHGKGNRDRYVPITNRALLWIDRYLRNSRPKLATSTSGTAFFLSREGKPISRDHLTFVTRQYIKKAQLNKQGACHIFRHTIATLMHENGADIRIIQQLLGHADIRTTQIYTQVAIRTLQQVHAATTRHRDQDDSISKARRSGLVVFAGELGHTKQRIVVHTSASVILLHWRARRRQRSSQQLPTDTTIVKSYVQRSRRL